jgi:glyoxylase-like metal-dependent hydrolase (beta-lactamase superfamily II)
MIRLQAIGLYSSDFSGGETRLGDATIIDDGKNYEVIDGYCGNGTMRLIAALKARGIKNPYLHITHPHYDHRYGIRKIINDSWFKPKALYCQNPDSITAHNSDVKSDIDALRTVIREAKAKGITVVYLNNGDKIVHGEIKFTVYRRNPAWDGSSEAYLNEGSLCYWFPEQSYLTTGDASMWCAEKYNLHPKWVKGGHHGNDIGGLTLKPSQMAQWLKKNGCLYYWDNDFSTRITDFLQTGREDAQTAGMKYFDIHGDINAIFFRKRAVIYKHGQIYRYACSYNGAPTLAEPNLENVKMVLAGKAGTDDARVTYLLNRSMNPGLIQKEVNELYKLIKG